MLITPAQLVDEPIQLDESLAAGVIEYAPDIRQIGPLTLKGDAALILEHRGPKDFVQDVRLRAHFEGRFEVLCARCVEPVATPLTGNFDLIFRPQDADAEAGERAITLDETEIGYYEESGLSLEDVVREQVLLSLPSRTLCKEDCKGLCPRCGQNLNLETCKCDTASDPASGTTRWNALAGLASTVKSR